MEERCHPEKEERGQEMQREYSALDWALNCWQAQRCASWKYELLKDVQCSSLQFRNRSILYCLCMITDHSCMFTKHCLVDLIFEDTSHIWSSVSLQMLDEEAHRIIFVFVFGWYFETEYICICNWFWFSNRIYCGFCLSRILLYFHLSVCLSVHRRDIFTFHLYIIMLNMY